jgi:hypothetical protein
MMIRQNQNPRRLRIGTALSFFLLSPLWIPVAWITHIVCGDGKLASDEGATRQAVLMRRWRIYAALASFTAT